jgi:hypothetical protein
MLLLVGGVLDGFSVGNVAGFVFSHFLFADDTLFFCGAHPAPLHHLHCLFLHFEVASGLKVNLANFKLVPVGNVEHVKSLAGILGCGVSSHW